MRTLMEIAITAACVKKDIDSRGDSKAYGIKGCRSGKRRKGSIRGEK